MGHPKKAFIISIICFFIIVFLFFNQTKRGQKRVETVYGSPKPLVHSAQISAHHCKSLNTKTRIYLVCLSDLTPHNQTDKDDMLVFVFITIPKFDLTS